MAKTLLLLGAGGLAAAVGATVVYLPEDDKTDTKETVQEEFPAFIRYYVKCEGLTEENRELVDKALESIEGVENSTAMPLKSHVVVKMKPKCKLQEESVAKVFERVRGVELRQIEAIPSPTPAPN